MLKWLYTRPKLKEEIITDDPFATLNLKRKKARTRTIYAVSRVNPIFEDEEADHVEILSSSASITTPQPYYTSLPRRNNSNGTTSSSGYDSGHHTDSTSSDDSGGRQNRVNRGRLRSVGSTVITLPGGSQAPPPPPPPPRQENERPEQPLRLTNHRHTIDMTSCSRPHISVVHQNSDYVHGISVDKSAIPRPIWPSDNPGVTVVNQDLRYIKNIQLSPKRTRVIYDHRPHFQESQEPMSLPEFRTGLSVRPREDHKVIDNDGDDSIATDSVLILTSFSYDPRKTEAARKWAEATQTINSEEALKELSTSLSRRAPVARLTRALSSDTDSVDSSDISGHNRKQRIRGIVAVKDLWDRSGRRLNGRRLLVESGDEDEGGTGVRVTYGRREVGATTADTNRRTVATLEPNDPAVLVPASTAVAGNNWTNNVPRQPFYNPQNRFSLNYSRLGEHEDSTSSSSEGTGNSPPPGLRRLSSQNGLPTVDLDAVEVEIDAASQASSQSRRVTFAADTKDNERAEPDGKAAQEELHLNPRFLHEELHRAPLGLQNALLYGNNRPPQPLPQQSKEPNQQLWENYYSGGDNKSFLTNLPQHPNYPVQNYENSVPTPDFTLDAIRHQVLIRKIKAHKKRRCIWRIVAILFLLTVFVLVVIAVSLLYTRGQRFFGSA